MTTYQYSNDSDVDLSVFVDTESFPEWSRAEMIGLMISHFDGHKLPGTTHPMQGFVVSSKLKKEDLYAPGLRSGYDLQKDKWIVPPDPTRSHDVEREMNMAYEYALESADKMERLLRYEPDKAVQFWHQIHKRRMRDQTQGKGDFSESNIVYKFLANRGLFPKISEVSGEYIAKTAWFGDKSEEPLFPPGSYQEWQDAKNKQYNGMRDLKHRIGPERKAGEALIRYREQRRLEHWTTAYANGISPHEMNGQAFGYADTDQGMINHLHSKLQNYHGRAFPEGYTPEMNADWHRRYQQEMFRRFQNNPTATPADYQNWVDWYAQHAPEHFDPEGTAINQEVAPQEPKQWFEAKTANPQLFNPQACPRCGGHFDDVGECEQCGYMIPYDGYETYIGYDNGPEWAKAVGFHEHHPIEEGWGPRRFGGPPRPWIHDPRAIDKARQHLGLQNPVQVNKVDGTAGRYRGLVNGTHHIDVVNWLQPESASKQIWHEMAHALQNERDPEAFSRELGPYMETYNQGHEAYVNHPWEQEAHEVANLAPFPLTTPSRLANNSPFETPPHPDAVPWTPGKPGKGFSVGDRIFGWSDWKGMPTTPLHHDEAIDALSEDVPGNIGNLFFVDNDGRLLEGYGDENEALEDVAKRHGLQVNKDWKFSKIAVNMPWGQDFDEWHENKPTYDSFTHQLGYDPEIHDEGKGFVLDNGAIWTWPTHKLRPMHLEYSQKLKRAGGKSSLAFHIDKDGVYTYGPGRDIKGHLDKIYEADPRLAPKPDTPDWNL